MINYGKSKSWIIVLIVVMLLSGGSYGCKKKQPGPSASGSKVERQKISVPTAAEGLPEELNVLTLPGNDSSVRNLRQPLVVRFSQAVDSASFSFQVEPDPGGWKANWRDQGRTVILTHAHPFQPGAGYVWKLEVTHHGQKPVRKQILFQAFGPSALDLIDEAEKAGTLDLDQAWTYRIYALLSPEKLPEKYRSSTVIPSGTSVLIGYSQVKDRLKPETREALKPYFIRPSDPGSFYAEEVVSDTPSAFVKQEARPAFQMASILPSFRSLFARAISLRENQRPNNNKFQSAKAEGTPIKVWSSKSLQSAQTALDLITGYNMYGKFESLMGLRPISDAGEKYPDGKPNNGGDGDLDIYLISRRSKTPSLNGAMGMCIPTNNNQKTPCFILIREELAGKFLGATIAHELFHAFQMAIDSKEQKWWLESTAVWAEDFIGPDWDTEQDYLPEAFDLETYMLKPLTSDAELHEYGIYLFPYYLSTKFGREVIGRIWKDFEIKMPSRRWTLLSVPEA